MKRTSTCLWNGSKIFYNIEIRCLNKFFKKEFLGMLGVGFLRRGCVFLWDFKLIFFG